MPSDAQPLRDQLDSAEVTRIGANPGRGLAPSVQDLSIREREKVQVRTFHLLWCQGCGHAAVCPEAPSEPDFTAPSVEVMRCNDCGQPLHLIECFTAPASTMWQEKPGAIWQHVVYRDKLPGEEGRWRWIER